MIPPERVMHGVVYAERACKGRVKSPPKRRKTREERFWAKVKVGEADECWEWTGAVCGYPPTHLYGHFFYEMVDGKPTYEYAHRYVWREKHGEIPKGMCVCHVCDNPGCCNPDHLFLGTHRDNMIDRDKKGRGKGAENLKKARMARKGDHPGAKLTPEQVLEIRRIYKPHNKECGAKALSIRYGVHRNTIYQIISRTTWTPLKVHSVQ